MGRMGMDSQKAILNKLRKEIISLGGIKSPAFRHEPEKGLQEMAAHFPFGVFPLAAVHEFVSDGPEQLAASTGFIASLLKTCFPADVPFVWINTTHGLFPQGLVRFGIQPHKVLVVRPAGQKETNWCLEEALQCSSIMAVVAETADLNFTNSRRFQLAVEKSRATGFIINTRPRKSQRTACITRWEIRPLPGELPDGMPGLGYPRWKVQLQKVRNGKPGNWDIAWINQEFSFGGGPPVLLREKEARKTG